MASDMLIQHLHLIQSVLSQKVGAKPRKSLSRESSQGRAVMRGREVASPLGETGLPLGLGRGRASIFLAKSVQSASFQTGLLIAYADSDAATTQVLPAITLNAWIVHSTDEVPRRPDSPNRVTAGHKPYAKGQSNASETGTAFPRPRPKGCQQRQSRGSTLGLVRESCSERQNLRVPFAPTRFMGPVSSVLKSHQLARRDLLLSKDCLAKQQTPTAGKGSDGSSSTLGKSPWHCFPLPNQKLTP